jgi:hypothetical protein
MAHSSILCPETGRPVLVNVDIAATALEKMGKMPPTVHILKSCPECNKDHNWTVSDLSAVSDH